MHHFFYLHNFGYLGLYLSLALGIMGIPMPDEALMTYVGFLVYKGTFSLGAAIIVSFLGSVTGMSLSFFIGRGLFSSLGRRLETRYGTGYIRYRSLMARYGNIIIVVGYFFPFIRQLTAYSSGLLKMKYSRFLCFASIGGLLWAVSFISLGYLFGPEWMRIYVFINNYKILAITLSLVYLAFLLYLGRKKINPDNI